MIWLAYIAAIWLTGAMLLSYGWEMPVWMALLWPIRLAAIVVFAAAVGIDALRTAGPWR